MSRGRLLFLGELDLRRHRCQPSLAITPTLLGTAHVEPLVERFKACLHHYGATDNYVPNAGVSHGVLVGVHNSDAQSASHFEARILVPDNPAVLPRLGGERRLDFAGAFGICQRPRCRVAAVLRRLHAAPQPPRHPQRLDLHDAPAPLLGLLHRRARRLVVLVVRGTKGDLLLEDKGNLSPDVVPPILQRNTVILKRSVREVVVDSLDVSCLLVSRDLNIDAHAHIIQRPRYTHLVICRLPCHHPIVVILPGARLLRVSHRNPGPGLDGVVVISVPLHLHDASRALRSDEGSCRGLMHRPCGVEPPQTHGQKET
mmetsp:Transcript_58706/g.135355  ORF Transcript_58706/g.135355 Transcript_58706/m.135355 type:complete len:314 (-) Transcript_58706:50-991(-)